MKMLSSLALLLVVPVWSAPSVEEPYPVFTGEMTVDGQTALKLDAGKSAEWQFRFKKDGTPLGQFMMMHAKLQHLVVISQDLGHFAHIHPQYVKDATDPHFKIQVNSPATDPDNFDLPRVAPFNGNYYVMSEVMPMQNPMVMNGFVVEASGGKPAPRQIQPPLQNAGVETTQYFTREGVPAKEKAAFKLVSTVDNMLHCRLPTVRFEHFLYTWNENAQSYGPVKNLQNWLMMVGHGILMSEMGVELKDKTFRHMHSVYPSNVPGAPRGPEVVLVMHDHTLDRPFEYGTYRYWLQLKWNDQVYTFPMRYDLSKPLGPETQETDC